MASYAPLDFKEWKPQFGTINSFTDDLLKYFDNTLKVDTTDHKILATKEDIRANLQDPLLSVNHKRMSKSLSTLSSHHTDSVVESINKIAEENDKKMEHEKEEKEDEDNDDDIEKYDTDYVEEEEQEESVKENEKKEIDDRLHTDNVERASNISLESSHNKEDEDSNIPSAIIKSSGNDVNVTTTKKSESIQQPTMEASTPAAPETMRFLNSPPPPPPSPLRENPRDKSIIRKSSAFFVQKIKKPKPTVMDEQLKTKIPWWRKLRFFSRD